MMIAGGYMVDEKKGNPALDMAMKLAIDEIESAQLEDKESQQQQAKVNEPALGSYERIMQAFGGKLVT
jgi:hypothetical protein